MCGCSFTLLLVSFICIYLVGTAYTESEITLKQISSQLENRFQNFEAPFLS